MWCDEPLPARAPTGGLIDPLNGRAYKGGELLPFYVPRPVMPQVDEAAYPALLAFAKAWDIEVDLETGIDPATLRAHQRIDPIRAAEMPPEVLAKPILVSLDGYILDGNHRWLAHVHLDAALTAYRIDLPFEAAIRLLFDFPGTYDLADKPEGN